MAFVSQTKTTETLPVTPNQNHDSSFLMTLLLLIAGAKASKRQLRKLKRRLFFNMMKLQLQRLFKKDRVNWPVLIICGLLAVGLLIWIFSMGGFWIVLGTIAFVVLLYIAAGNE